MQARVQLYEKWSHMCNHSMKPVNPPSESTLNCQSQGFLRKIRYGHGNSNSHGYDMCFARPDTAGEYQLELYHILSIGVSINRFHGKSVLGPPFFHLAIGYFR